MDNDSGTGSRSDQPPPLATVRPLHLNDVAPDSGAAEDDWYETERLTGQITGRARSTAAADEPAIGAEPTLVLDWRHTDPSPAPSAAQRLRRNLERRRLPKVRLRVLWRDSSLRRRRRIIATPVPQSEHAELPASPEHQAAVGRKGPTGPLLGFRHEPEPQSPKAGRPLGVRVRERMPHVAWGRGVGIVALTLLAAATATIGIAAALSGSPAKPRRAAVAATGSAQIPDFGAAAKALTAAVGFIEHPVRGSASARHAVRARRATHRRSRGIHQHPPGSRSAAPGAAPSPVSTASSYGSSSSSPSYSGSSSALSTSSQSGTSEPASTASRSQSTHQPVFGQNGSLGPGRGAPGTQ